MNIRTLSEKEIADLAAYIATLLAGAELSAIDSHVRADLITALGTLPDDLLTQTADATVLDTQKRAAVGVRDQTYAEVITWMNRVRDALRSALAGKKQFELCGFDVPAVRSSKYVAQDPTEMSVSGFSIGINKGVFKGNNRTNAVMYEIWRREGDTGEWHAHLLTKRQSFVDKGVNPGQFYEYRVRAVAAQTVSNFSNSAVVYGVL